MLALMLVVLTTTLGGASCMAQLDPDAPISTQEEERAPELHERGIAGEVKSADGQPIAGAMIEVKSLDQPSPPIPERIVLSQADGRFFWPLKPGNYEVSATAAGYQSMTARVRVEAEGGANLDLVLDKLR